MILVDTSIWVDLLGRKPRHSVTEEDLLRFTTCGPIVQEVLQGLRPGLESDLFREAFRAIPVISDPIPLGFFISAAEIYGNGRKRGFTVRSSVDCLIATIAIRNDVPVWHRDRDFQVIARYTNLQIARDYHQSS